MIKGLVQSITGWLGKPVATPETDPAAFFGMLSVLPNPDPILRKIGMADKVYASIMADGHVLGELRSIRGNFRKHKYRVRPGDGADPRSVAAKDLCEAYLANCIPNEVAGDWLEVMWQMSMAFYYGYRPHEVTWDLNASHHKLLKGKILPTEVVDRPNRRFVFDFNGKPLLISRGNLMGAPVEPYQFLISRHMATMENPYGQAVASALFWCWTFKTGGWRFFVKYCERHGIPWPIARYPMGTGEKDIDKLEEAMKAMLESAYAVVQEGSGVELLSPTTGTGDLPQERLIRLCNTEMSKALNGHAMVAELGKVGARAASETAADRQDDVNNADRDVAAGSMGRLFMFITQFNIGDDVAPPSLELYRRENAGKERAEAYNLVRNMGGRPSKRGLLEEMGIDQAEDDEDALLPDAPATSALTKPGPGPVEFSARQLRDLEGWAFAQAAGMTEAEALELAANAADEAIEKHLIEPVYQMLAQYEREGKTIDQFRDDLVDMVPGLDDEALRDVLDQALTFGILQGAATTTA